MQRDDQRLTGTLRVAAPFGYGRARVAPMLARFARLHPGLRVQLDLRETPWPDKHDADAVHCKACGKILNIPDEGLT